ncbi:MAG: ABC transporter permease [Eubacteriales bacterium]
MKSFDVFKMGLRNLTRRKTRTLLTVVGVVVGAASIVIMISLGIGMNESLDRSMAQMGDLTVIELQQYAWVPGEDGSDGTSGENKLTAELVEQIKTLDGVLAVTPYLSLYEVNIYAGRRYQLQYPQIMGIDPDYLQYLGYEVSGGEMPTSADKNFLLFGSDQIYQFMDPNKPIRDWNKEFFNDDGTRKPPKVDILKEELYVQPIIQNNSGGGYYGGGYGGKVIMESYGSDDGSSDQPTSKPAKKYPIDKVGIMLADPEKYETNYMIFADLEMVREIILEMEKANKTKAENSRADKYDTIKVKTKDIKTAELVQQKIKDMGIITYGLSDIRKSLQKNQATMQLILGGIGAMSLIVAAIGIANTMYMSIYERTKEIGVMKVLGCPLGGIKSMFLFEAGIIGFLGGVLGISISLLTSYAMNTIPAISKVLGGISGSGGGYYIPPGGEGAISVIPPWLILVAIAFSTVVGILSGYLPSYRATRISALAAIRNE